MFLNGNNSLVACLIITQIDPLEPTLALPSQSPTNSPVSKGQPYDPQQKDTHQFNNPDFSPATNPVASPPSSPKHKSPVFLIPDRNMNHHNDQNNRSSDQQQQPQIEPT
ncbi:hypothetical protein R6Q59_029286 [Mikania micrantha]